MQINNLQPADYIKNKILNINKKLKLDKNIFGVHARGTDFQSDVKQYIEKMRKITTKYPKAIFYIATDDKKYQDKIINEFPNNTILTLPNKEFAKKINENLDYQLNTLISEKAMIDGIVDLYLLSKTNIKIGHQHSAFFQLSKIISNSYLNHNKPVFKKTKADIGNYINNIKPLPLIDPVRKFVLFTNAKCGGTTLKRWFLKNLNLDTLIHDNKKLRSYFGSNMSQKLKSYNTSNFSMSDVANDVNMLRAFIDFYRNNFSRIILDSHEINDYFKIIVSRNPYYRVVSAFLDKFCGNDRNKPFVISVNNKMNNHNISFYDFLVYLQESDETYLDPHWRRQSYIIDQFQINFVIPLENHCTLTVRQAKNPF